MPNKLLESVPPTPRSGRLPQPDSSAAWAATMDGETPRRSPVSSAQGWMEARNCCWISASAPATAGSIAAPPALLASTACASTLSDWLSKAEEGKAAPWLIKSATSPCTCRKVDANAAPLPEPKPAGATAVAAGLPCSMFDAVAAVGAVGCIVSSRLIELFLAMQHALHDGVLFDQQVAIPLAQTFAFEHQFFQRIPVSFHSLACAAFEQGKCLRHGPRRADKLLYQRHTLAAPRFHRLNQRQNGDGQLFQRLALVAHGTEELLFQQIVQFPVGQQIRRHALQ